MMNDLMLVLIRDKTVRPVAGEAFTPGKMYQAGAYFCETCEDEDRFIEKGGEKVKGKTAIPRGTYEVTLYKSPKHGLVPLLKGVAGFDFIEIHGGNKAEDSLGCILAGRDRTPTGIANCAEIIKRLVDAIALSAANGRKTFITVK